MASEEQVQGELIVPPQSDGGIVESLAKRTGATAKASAVYGKPVKSGKVTVIPVARARWAFGGGGGTSVEGSGGGGGGAGWVSAIGYIEVRNGEAQFKPIRDRRWVGVGGAVLGLAGLVVAAITSRR